MGFGPPRGNEVSLVAVGVDDRDFQPVDEADGVNPDFAVVETVVYPLDGRPLENPLGVLRRNPYAYPKR